MAEPTPGTPTTGDAVKSAGKGINKKLAGLPIWAWGLIALAGVGVGIYFLKRGSSASNTPASSSPAADTLNTTPTSEQVPNTTGDQVYIVAPPTPVPPTTTGTSDTGTPTSTAQIRGKQTSGPLATYDNAPDRKGVPLRSSAGGSVSSEIPWGTSVNITGAAVSGGATGGGSSVYMPVSWNGQSGFVSALDLIGIGAGGSGGPMFPLKNRRNTLADGVYV